MPALADVIACLARAAGLDDGAAVRVGDVTLTPPQVRSAHLARAAVERYGGALLADRPGSGKTFVALAVAHNVLPRGRPLVLAPAALRAMWHDAARRADVPIAFHSLESLSRHSRPPPAPFIVVDEAHRAGHPTTRRYRRIAALAHHGRVLLLTATPVRNRGAERTALLALFLGAEAACADDDTIARCLIRGGRAAPATPRLVRHAPIVVPTARSIASGLRALPPPMALADGASAAGLVRMGLARAWSSSVAALHDALQRRLLRGAAIVATLDAGRVPTRADLRLWVLGDGALQMALPLDPVSADAAEVTDGRAAIERHLAAVARLHAAARAAARGDVDRRTAALDAILREHDGRTVVAFTCFETTARALFRAMQWRPGVVLLTAAGARSGAGPIPRQDVVNALGPGGGPSARSEPLLPIRFVIATDLLAEGVNLQRASVVVHLDQPWTPAAREQREGRAARMGSVHDAVDVYRFRESRAVAALTALEARHRHKARSAATASHPADAAASVRAVIARWRAECPATEVERHAVAATRGNRHAFVAAIVVDHCRRIVAGRLRRGAWDVADDPAAVLAIISPVQLAGLPPPTAGEVRRAGSAILRWARHRSARTAAGLARQSPGAERRVFARLQRSLQDAPPPERAAAAARADRIRAALSSARGVGSVHCLAGILATHAPGNAAFDDIEEAINGPGNAPPIADAACEIEALLFVRAGPD